MTGITTQQITVVANNSTGLIAELTSLLGDSDVDIRHLDSHLVGQDAYIKIVVSEYDKALQLLTRAGYRAVSDESFLLRVEDRPGMLARIARRISDHGIATRAMTMLHQDGAYTVVAVSTSDNEQAKALFEAQLVS